MWKFVWQSCFFLSGLKFHAKQMFVRSSSMKLGPCWNRDREGEDYGSNVYSPPTISALRDFVLRLLKIAAGLFGK